MIGQAKEKYFNNLNVKKVSDNRTFWKSVKSFFVNRDLNSNNILLAEENKIEMSKNSSYYKQVFYKYN